MAALIAVCRHRGGWVAAVSRASIALSTRVPTLVIVLLLSYAYFGVGAPSVEVAGLSTIVDTRSQGLALAGILGLTLGSTGYFAVALMPVVELADSPIGSVSKVYVTPVKWIWLLLRETVPRVVARAGPRLTDNLHNTCLLAVLPLPGLYASARSSAIAAGTTQPLLMAGAAYVGASAIQELSVRALTQRCRVPT